jgi:hypothetical protein
MCASSWSASATRVHRCTATTRQGALDPGKVGLSALGLAGVWFAAQSVLRDIAALNKEEMFPWDTWSVGPTCGPGQETPPRTAAHLDTVANVLRGVPGADLAQRMYQENEWLQVTPTVLSFPNGVPTEVAIATTE